MRRFADWFAKQPMSKETDRFKSVWYAMSDVAERQEETSGVLTTLIESTGKEMDKLADRVEALEKKVTGIYERIENYLTIETENEDVY